MTTFLGVLIVWVGLQIDATVGKYFVYFAASILWLMGLYYILRHLKGKSHSHIQLPFVSKRVNRLFRRQDHHNHDHDHHHHNDPDHAHEHFHEYSHVHAEGTTILGLFILLTCSPCEGFLPVYVSGISFGWAGFLLLTLILGIATLLGMVLFTSLALKGIDKLNIEFLEKYESLIMGVLLFLLGFVVIFVE
jgi:ABC-type nickel/cobalt efflux system permease component RcnA